MTHLRTLHLRIFTRITRLDYMKQVTYLRTLHSGIFTRMARLDYMKQVTYLRTLHYILRLDRTTRLDYVSRLYSFMAPH